MHDNDELKKILQEVSAAVSESLSIPAVLRKLEFLREKGFQLYLVMESADDSSMDKTPGPVMPIHVGVEKQNKSASGKRDMFSLSQDDKYFLRTLKIRVD